MSTPVVACANDIAVVVPSDTGNLARADGQLPCAFVVSGLLGDVAVTTADGSEITIPEEILAVGTIFPLSVRRIWDSGTTAAAIYVLYANG